MESKRKTSLSDLVLNHKESIFFEAGVLVVSVLVTILLLMFFVIPQFQSWLTMNSEAKLARDHIAVIKQNIDFINSLNEESLNKDFVLAASALPVDKDFSGAMQSILAAAVNSGATLKEFNFSVGTVASTSAQKTKSDLDPMVIDIETEGDIGNMKEFVSSLYTYLPLSNIVLADSGETASTTTQITISFPSKPLPQLTIDNTAPITRISAKNHEVLSKIQGWKEKADQISVEDTGSESADLPPPF